MNEHRILVDSIHDSATVIHKGKTMNKRIEKLAEQAELEYNFDPMLWMKYEKFAQLIVLECMNICAERELDIRTRIKDEGKAATAYMIRAYIKEHFGVEE